MSLPEDLKRLRADTANENAMFWLELTMWLVGGPALVVVISILVLSLT